MLVAIPQVLDPDQVTRFRSALAAADWVDGRVTAGAQSALAKNNLQIPEEHPVARTLGEEILAALGRNPAFVAAALFFVNEFMASTPGDVNHHIFCRASNLLGQSGSPAIGILFGRKPTCGVGSHAQSGCDAHFMSA